MDNQRGNRISGAMGWARSATAGAPPRPASSRSIGGRATLRLVHSLHERQEAGLPRAVPAGLADKRLFERGEECAEPASAGHPPQRIDLHRTGNSWSWAGTSYASTGLRCQEAFDCRIWRRGTSRPVLIAAIAAGVDPAATAGVGAALAVSALLNILDEDMTGYLERDRLPALLRGAVGEVQLLLQQRAQQDRRPIGDYDSALLAVILTRTGGVIGQIGGGSAMIQEEDGAWRPVHWCGQGGYANKARSLTEADAFSAFGDRSPFFRSAPDLPFLGRA